MTVADRYIEQMHFKFQLLVDQPGIGTMRDEMEPGLRAYIYKSHIIYYLATDHLLTIVRVIHGRRDQKQAWDELKKFDTEVE